MKCNSVCCIRIILQASWIFSFCHECCSTWDDRSFLDMLCLQCSVLLCCYSHFWIGVLYTIRQAYHLLTYWTSVFFSFFFFVKETGLKHEWCKKLGRNPDWRVVMPNYVCECEWISWHFKLKIKCYELIGMLKAVGNTNEERTSF